MQPISVRLNNWADVLTILSIFCLLAEVIVIPIGIVNQSYYIIIELTIGGLILYTSSLLIRGYSLKVKTYEIELTNNSKPLENNKIGF